MPMMFSEFLARELGVESVDSTQFVIGGRDAVSFLQSHHAYFHLVLAGSAAIRVDGGEAVRLQAGDFALMLYGSAHTICGATGQRAQIVHTADRWIPADEPGEVNLCRNGEPAARVLSGRLCLTHGPRRGAVHRTLPYVLCFRRDDTGVIEAVVRLDQIERGCHGPGAAMFVLSVVQLYLVQTLRQVRDEVAEIFPIHFGAPDMGRMTALVRKIRQHPEMPWTVASLALEIGCSRSSFAAKFHAYAGVSPIHFVTRIRLTEASMLLKSNPDLSVGQVARRVGYESQSAFTRAFKAHFGITPRIYVNTMLHQTDGRPDVQQIPAPRTTSPGPRYH